MNLFPVPTGAPRWWLLGLVVGVCSALPLVAQYPDYGGSSDSSSRPWELPIYFPPFPPLLGSPVPLPALATPRRATPAPALLAEYVNEIFYAPLSTRLDKNQLTARQQEKLQSYRVAKVALQNELENRLQELKTADPATRSEALADLARAQAPRLLQLERAADELRHEFIHGEFFQRNVDWNAIRGWRLGNSRFSGENDAIAAQYQVMLASAFYQNGLLPEQRNLLREIALELRYTPRRSSMTDDSVGVKNPPFFFSPATSRLILPPEIPADLSAKIATYEHDKATIKAELRDTVYAEDKTFFSRSRNRALEALAERQWPRISALEDLAEDIRRDLARLPHPPGPPAPPALPAAISSHITQFLTDKNQLSADVVRKLEELKRRFPFIRLQTTRNPAGGTDLKLSVDTRGQNEEDLKTLRATMSAFNQDVATRQGELKIQQDALRREFALTVPPDETRSVEGILDAYADIIQQREDWSLYAVYQSAMLTPGLSPEQRRLLFDRGLERLELPLPYWEQIFVRIVN